MQGLHALADLLQTFREDTSQDICQKTERIAEMCNNLEVKARTAARDFAQLQSGIRMSLSSPGNEALATMLSNRDAARANMCRELRNLLDRTAQGVSGQNKLFSYGQQGIHTRLAEAVKCTQQLSSALDAARQCVIEYNTLQNSFSARMGAALRDFGLDADLNLAKSLSMLNLAKSLSMWQTWRANMQYEEVAQETDACMQAAHDSCTKNLHALLGISKKLPDAQQRTRIQDSLTAAGEAVDRETNLQASNPMLLVPELFLVSSAEQHLGGMQEYVAILQRVCKVYDDILALPSCRE
jgi:hypothetical protein